MEGTRLGKYEIRTTIGRGAVGTVYEGWDTTLMRKVAIKTLPLMGADEEGRERQARFLREARAAAGLYHPNIVAIYDYGETDSLAYIVMELIGGRPLDAVLEHGARLPTGEVAAVMEGLLAGLQHSHENGVVHRDIKPANIVLSIAGTVKITDFGIAHLESSDMTRVGSVMGTPAYMAPEQVLGAAVDARTDVYAAGVLLYQMLLGRRPFEGGTASIMHKIINAQPDLPANLLDGALPGIATVLGTALAKRPGDRYASARKFANALRVEFGPAAALPPGHEDDATVVAGPGTLPGVLHRTRTSTGAGTGSVTGSPRGPAMDPATEPNTVPPARTMPGTVPASGAPPLPGGQAAGTPRQQRTRARPAVLPLAVLGVAVLAGAGWWWTLRQPDVPQGTVVAQPPPPAPVMENPARAEVPASDATPLPVQPAGPPSLPQPNGRSSAALALQAALNEAATTLPCTLLRADAGHDGLDVNGLTALGDSSGMQVQAVLRRIAARAVNAPQVEWDIRRIDGPYCGVLDVLRTAWDPAAGPAPLLSLPAQAGVPAEAMPIEVMATVPAGEAVLVDFYTPDRAVTHVPLPLAQDGRITLPAPPGAGLVTLIASPDALVPPGRPAREPASAYLEVLRAGLVRAHGVGGRVAVTAIVVEGRPR